MLDLDKAATTPVRREALEAMWPYLTGEYGNPSSVHGPGQRAAGALEDARRQVAAMLGARAGEVVFTSGGTEAINFIIKGIALAQPRGKHVLVAATEHEAVLASADALAKWHGFGVERIPVGATGLVEPAVLRALLRTDTTLVSIALANNEVGTVQPVAELAALTHEVGAAFHTDAVQAAGWLSLQVADLGVDAMSLSGHKFGAPKGIGAAWVRSRLQVEPLLHGGGQERGRRSGTENVAGAVAFGVAATLTEQERLATDDVALAATRDAFAAALLAEVPTARLTGDPVHRLPGHLSVTLGAVSGESVLLELESAGVLASSGSACHAGSDEPSPTLLAMGIAPEVAQTALRFTFGREVARADLQRVAAAVGQAVSALTGGGW
jgi:cysteine desulfurase